MKTAMLLALCALWVSSAAAAPRDDWVSGPPVTYVLDYGGKHLGYPEWLQMTTTAPPMLLHVGKDVPMTHNWGPIVALGGENQAYGKGDNVRRLSPDELTERIAGLKEMVSSLHASGVEMVMPYICSMTIAGHHETRTGLWEFYDHWDEYAQFGIGPRPELDVTDWLQRTPEGDMVRFYSYTGDFYPAYEPNHRYAACVNNPAWQQWLYTVTRLVAECGYDGVFVDNSGSQRCYCDYCRNRFRDAMSAKYTAEQLRDLFGFATRADIHLGSKDDGLLWVETQRFWIESLHRHQVAIAAAGRAVVPGFRVFPNGGHGRPEHVKLAYPDSDHVMFEKSVGDFGTNPGLARFNVVGDIFINKYNDNIYEHKLVTATRSHARPIILSRGGYPREQPELRLNEATACLGMAEAAAYGSGGGFLIRPQYDRFGPALKLYGAFFTDHADLYTGMVPHARVGLLCLPEQKLMGNADHIEMVQGLCRALSDAHVLFDMPMEEALVPDGLRRFDAVIMAGVKYLAPEQASALGDYVRAGGRLLTIDPLPSHDLLMQPYDAASLYVVPGAVARGDADTILRLRSLPMRTVADDLSTLTGAEPAVLFRGDAPAPRSIRINAWRGTPQAAHRLVYHLLDYATALGDGAPGPAPVEGLSLRLPADEVKGRQVSVWEPGAEAPLSVDVSLDGDTAHLDLPPLRVYQVVAID